MEGLVIMLIFVGVIVAIAVAMNQARRADESWQAAARTLGLRYTPAAFLRQRCMSGRWHGFGVKVDTYTQGSGKNSKICTRFRIAYPRPLGLGLRLTEEGFFTGVTKLFGAQDIEVGDRTFDDSVLVKGASARRVREFLTPARRARLHRFLMSHRGAAVADDAITWSQRGVLRDAATIVRTVKQLAGVARSLITERRDDRALGRAIKAQHEGRVDEALATLESRRPSVNREEEAAAAPSEAVDEKVLRGKLLYLMERRGEALEAFKEAQDAAPEDPEIKGWVDHVTEAPAQAPAEAGAEAAAPVALDAPAVCAALFGSEVASFDAARLFEERYAGRQVTWSGKLRGADAYSFDFVFGDEPGVKATVEIGATDPSAYSEDRVLAIVQLPRDTAEVLAGKIGEHVTFTGVLRKVDGFMKNIYVAGGALEGTADGAP